MRYVVKDKQTGNFLSNSGAWTKYLGQAQRFPNSLSVGLHLEGARDRALAEQIEVIRIGAN